MHAMYHTLLQKKIVHSHSDPHQLCTVVDRFKRQLRYWLFHQSSHHTSSSQAPSKLHTAPHPSIPPLLRQQPCTLPPHILLCVTRPHHPQFKASHHRSEHITMHRASPHDALIPYQSHQHFIVHILSGSCSTPAHRQSSHAPFLHRSPTSVTTLHGALSILRTLSLGIHQSTGPRSCSGHNIHRAQPLFL